MQDVLVPIVIVPVIFFSMVYAIRIMSDNRVRRHIIDKGLLDENVKYLFQKQQSEAVPNALKWGMVLIALGLAVLIGQLMPYSFHEEATMSAMFILGGLALIVYYFIAKKMAKNNDES